MTRFFLSAAFGLALALPALAQGQPQPRPNRGEDVEKLREQVRDLEAKLKKVSDKKEEKEDDKKGKGEQKGERKGEGEPKGPPMGGFTGGFPGPMGSFGGQGFGRNPFAGNPGAMPGGPGGEGGRGGSSGMSGGPDFTKMPGFERLTKDEQKMLANLFEKMHADPMHRSTMGTTGAPGHVEARLDRLEKTIEELKAMMRGPTPSGPGRPPGSSGSGGPGGGQRGGGGGDR